MLFFHKNKRENELRTSRKYFVAIFLLFSFIASFATVLIMKAQAAEVPIPSVEITSQYSNHANNDPGSWKITKSARWMNDTSKAQITFKVESIAKHEENKNYDVVLVIDNSGSMEGNKIDQVKADATDLTNTLLSDRNNNIALVAFSTNAMILSDFTNDRTKLTEIIDGIDIDGMTNYYDGLLKAESVLDGYQQKDGHELVLLFLTDGLPNEDTPNEIAQYHKLKTMYPFMTITGIQYEMGKEILEPIIQISDYQYIADIDSLNNVLFNATISPYIYDDFILTDYINDDYWTISGLEALKASLGEINLEYDIDTPVITWDMSGLYRSGNIATLTINIDLKSNYVNSPDATDLLLPTNRHETVQTKLQDTPDENIDSPKTPILKSNYAVIYEANAPAGCNIQGSVPAATNHTVFTIVEIQNDNKISCSGYSFKGWKISTENINFINDDYFLMPEEDVHIKAIWTKPSISKSIEGTPHIKAAAIFDVGRNVNAKMKKLSGQSTATYSTSNTTITTIAKADTLSSMVDISDDEYILSSPDSAIPIYGWYDNGIIYFYTDAEIACLNPNSSYLFYQMRSLSGINSSELIASNVTNMSYMFYVAGYNSQTFNIDLSNWDTSKVTNMSGMFYSAGYNSQTFIIDLSGWDTSNVTTINNLFSGAGYGATNWSLEGLSNWDTSKVTDMTGSFEGAGYNSQTFDIDLSDWDTSNVINMDNMFSSAGYNSQTFNIDLSNWDTSKVTEMVNMFGSTGYNATNWSIGNISSWDTSNVTDMSYMFHRAGYKSQTFNLDLSSWNTSNVTNIYYMFNSAGYSSQTFNINLSGWDVSKVTDMSRLFESAGNSSRTFNINLSGWDASNTTSTFYMFYNAGQNSQTFSINLSDWNTSNVTNMSYMFYNAGRYATTWSIDGLYDCDTPNVTNMSYMFYNAGLNSQTFNIDLSSWDTSNVINMSYMFNSAGYRAPTFSINLSNWDTSKVTNMRNMFDSAGRDSQTFSLDLSNWDTSSVTNMSNMFFSAGRSATNWSIGNLSGWDTSNVTNMSSMFVSAGYNATNWSIGSLSDWDTSKVTNMSTMFNSAGRSSQTFSLDLSNWDISKVTNISSMFGYSGYSATTWSVGDLSNWDTSSLTNMESLFSSAGYSATTWSVGDLSNWDTSKVTNMSYLFNSAGYSAHTFNVNLSNWNTQNVTSMTNTFSKAGYSATTWTVTIPANNGAGIANTTSKLYGKTTSVAASPDSDKSFTLAP